MSAIEVEDLRVTYTPRGAAPVEAVRGVSFHVEEGEIFGLLGPNGAGKTSTLEVCEGFRAPTSGAVRVLGLVPDDPRTAMALRRRVGIVLQDIAVEPFLTVAEAVTRNAGYYARPRAVDEVLATVGLAEKAAAKVKTLSGGQQRRLDLALGIVGRPTVLFLDEPTTGFDPSARRDAWDVVRNLREQGTTVVLTTHYLDEAEALADRLCVISAGQVIAEGSPRELAGRSRAPVHIRFNVASTMGPVPVVDGDDQSVVGETITIVTTQATRSLYALTGWAVQQGVELDGLVVQRVSLEDVYLELTRSTP